MTNSTYAMPMLHVWYPWKRFVNRSPLMEFSEPLVLKRIAWVNVLKGWVKCQSQGHQFKTSASHGLQKDPVTRNTRVKYQSPSTYPTKIIVNVILKFSISRPNIKVKI
jgi:hypothetical protein